MAAMYINETTLAQWIEEKRTFLIDFRADWCPDCRRIDPAYEQMAEEYADALEMVKFDMGERGKWPNVDVRRIPTLRLYVDGVAVGETVEPESRAVIEEFLGEVLPKRGKDAGVHTCDMVIIGGGPGGYTAALYAARAGLEAVVIEKLSAGGQMAQTHQIDNYPGFADGIEGWELALQMQRQAERFGAKTVSAEVRGADLAANPKRIETTEGVYYGRTVVLATGANPRELGLPEEKALLGRGVAYCAACDGMFYKGRTVVVVGGGDTAATDALLLSRIASKVYLVHRRDALRATKIYHQQLEKAENVEFCWNSVVAAIEHGDNVTGVKLRNVKTGEESALAADGVFISVGRRPNTELAAGQIELDAGGYIVADESTRTSIPGVYAVGDVRTKALRQVVTAVADGAMAVHSAEAFLAESAQG